MKKLTNKEKIYSYAAILLLIDQFIKILIRSKIELHTEVAITSFFSLYHITNTGAAFSVLSNHTTFLIFFTFVIIFLLDRYLTKETNFTNLSRISLGMIIGGVLGNLIDRIIFHGVTDYLLFIFGHKAFPVFNFADILITTGVTLYLIYCLLDLFLKKPKKNVIIKDKSKKTHHEKGKLK